MAKNASLLRVQYESLTELTSEYEAAATRNDGMAERRALVLCLQKLAYFAIMKILIITFSATISLPSFSLAVRF